MTIQADGEIETIFSAVSVEVKNRITNKKSRYPFAIFVNGGPGCGKRTLCKSLAANDKKYVHLNVGVLLKDKMSKGGSLADEINACFA